MEQFIQAVEDSIIPLALENSEGAFELAKLKVALKYSEVGILLTSTKIAEIVCKVWDRENDKHLGVIRTWNKYNLKTIGVWCLCNTASLNVFEITDETVTCSVND